MIQTLRQLHFLPGREYRCQFPTTQSAPVETEVPSRPSVTVEDTNQALMAGVTVTFAVTGGGGTVTGASQVTDASGKATVGEWVLGPNTGGNTLTASVAGSGITGNPVTFTATGTGGGPRRTPP